VGHLGTFRGAPCAMSALWPAFSLLAPTTPPPSPGRTGMCPEAASLKVAMFSLPSSPPLSFSFPVDYLRLSQLPNGFCESMASKPKRTFFISPGQFFLSQNPPLFLDRKFPRRICLFLSVVLQASPRSQVSPRCLTSPSPSPPTPQHPPPRLLKVRFRRPP